MGRNIDPVCKKCRREGMKLYLKGARCETKCPFNRTGRDTPAAPGMHGHRRAKMSEYGVRLREKQKLKWFYGLFERQFRRYFALASKSPENTGEKLLEILERRLDNVVHRLGFAPSRAAARQTVTHGHVLLNGKPCNIPSLLVKAGDTVTIKGRQGSLKLVKANLTEVHSPVPGFLEVTGQDPPEGRVTRLPGREDVDPRIADIREQLIIEVATR
jgi:small subunit ribosomal protein S4